MAMAVAIARETYQWYMYVKMVCVMDAEIHISLLVIFVINFLMVVKYLIDHFEALLCLHSGF